MVDITPQRAVWYPWTPHFGPPRAWGEVQPLFFTPDLEYIILIGLKARKWMVMARLWPGVGWHKDQQNEIDWAAQLLNKNKTAKHWCD